MEKYFESVGMLMSNLVRTCVENSVEELVTLVENYPEGNSYEGLYDIYKGLALPTKIHPIKIYMVSSNYV